MILFFETQKQLKITYHAHGPEKIICVNKELIFIRPRGTRIKTNKQQETPRKYLSFIDFQVCLSFLLEDFKFLRCQNFCLEKK